LPVGPRADAELRSERPIEVGDVSEARVEGDIDDSARFGREPRRRGTQRARNTYWCGV